MNFLSAFILIICCSFVFTSCTKDKVSKIPSPDGYYENEWDTPLRVANDYDRNIYVQFYAEWCSLCASFKEEVLILEDVESYLEENFVPVLLDEETGVGRELFEQHSLSGHPLSVIFDKDGNVIAQKRGKMDKETFLDWIADYE